jgi:hypothetical protein
VTRDLGNGRAVLEYLAPWGRPIAKWEPLFGPAAQEEIEALESCQQGFASGGVEWNDIDAGEDR